MSLLKIDNLSLSFTAFHPEGRFPVTRAGPHSGRDR